MGTFKKKKVTKTLVVRHVIVHHVYRHRLHYAFGIGGTSWILFMCFHVEVFKFLGEIMSVPAMEAFLTLGEE